MNDTQHLKLALYKACKAYVDTRESEILSTIESHQNALLSETKSSAGDKHETGRAMLQLEMEKSSKQLEGIFHMKEIMRKIDTSSYYKNTRLGSLVTTTKGAYYISISAGEIKIENKTYYAVSTNSPIGKMLLGTAPGDRIHFRSEIAIIDVV